MVAVKKIRPINSNRKVSVRENNLYYEQLMQGSDLTMSSDLEMSCPLWSEFTKDKAKIMSELRNLVVNDPYMQKIMATGNVSSLKKSAEQKAQYKRKWSLFLKYADVWDDDIKNLALLEFKKIYVIAQYEKKMAA